MFRALCTTGKFVSRFNVFKSVSLVVYSTNVPPSNALSISMQMVKRTPLPTARSARRNLPNVTFASPVAAFAAPAAAVVAVAADVAAAESAIFAAPAEERGAGANGVSNSPVCADEAAALCAFLACRALSARI